MSEPISAGSPTSPGPGSEITNLLAAARGGASDAAGRLFALVYSDMRALAARHAGFAGRGHGATSLVHEAFLRFARRGELPYSDHTHFFAVISRAMRQIVIDDFRSRGRFKRGGGAVVLDVDEVMPKAEGDAPPEEVLTIDAALQELEVQNPELAQVVEWHFFGGLTFAEIAGALQVSERTVLRHWRAARALLHARILGGSERA